MKTSKIVPKFIFCISVLMMHFGSLGQVESSIPRNYQLSATALLYQCTAEANTKDFPNMVSVPSGARFTIVNRITITKEKTDTIDKKPVKTATEEIFYVIQFWKWNGDDEDSKQKNDKYYQNPKTGAYIYFRLTPENLEFYATEYLKRWTPVAGTLAYPFKFRPQGNLTFSKDVALTGLGGFRRNFGASGAQSFSFTLGIGLSSVTLDSLNTRGSILQSSERAAATIPFSVIYQWERLQFALTIGIDVLSAESNDNWIYNRKPWFALGVGFAIFSSESTEIKDDSKKNK